jgi:hypothetical protein
MPKPPASIKNLPPSPANRDKKLPAPSRSTNAEPHAEIAPERNEPTPAPGPVPNESAAETGLSKNSSDSSENAAAREVTAVPVVGPRVSIGAALCEAGFDERAVASEYVKVVQSLARPESTDRSGATKLLVDVLKECSRQLDNTAGHRSGDAPVIVQLVHTVSRPVRAVPAPALTSANPSPAIEIAAPAAGSSADIESTNPPTEPS